MKTIETIARIIVILLWTVFIIIVYVIKPFYWLFKKLFFLKKTVLAIICISTIFLANSQTSTTQNIQLHNNYGEVLSEVTKSFLVSGTGYFITYEILFQNTDLSQNECRLIGTGSALLAGLTLSVFERNQKNSLGYNMYGCLLASFTLTITIGPDKKRDAKRKLINL